MLLMAEGEIYSKGGSGAQMALNVKKTTIKHVWWLDLCRMSKALGRGVQGKNMAPKERPLGSRRELKVAGAGVRTETRTS